MLIIVDILLLSFFHFCDTANSYPSHWWRLLFNAQHQPKRTPTSLKNLTLFF